MSSPTPSSLLALAEKVEARCDLCNDEGDVIRIDGEWLGYCDCEAGIARHVGGGIAVFARLATQTGETAS